MKYLFVLVGWLWINTASGVFLPDTLGFINITKAPYCADNTGNTDVSDIIQKAMFDAAKATKGIFKSIDRAVQGIYFPAGTYLISKPLCFDNAEILAARPSNNLREHQYVNGLMMLIGEDHDNTIIKLKDNTPLFQNGKTAVIRFTSKESTNQDYFNRIVNLTINTGYKNPGAVALDYVSNNIGSIEKVVLVSPDTVTPSETGLQLLVKVGGLSLISDLYIKGFKKGIHISGKFPAYTFKNIKLENQHEAGIFNEDKLISIINLVSNNAVPAVVNHEPSGIISMVNATLYGANNQIAAIKNFGHIYLRNISAYGYKSVLNQPVVPDNQNYIAEFSSQPLCSLWPESVQKSEHLLVKNIPCLQNNSNENLYVLFDPQLQDDDTKALQLLIDKGAETIYIKGDKGKLKLTSTIYLRNRLRRLNGGWCSMEIINSGEVGMPLFQFETGKSDIVILEAFNNGQGRNTFTTFQNNSLKTVVLKDLMMGYGYCNYRNTGNGELYIENVVTGGGDYPDLGEQEIPGWIFNTQKVWAYNLNPEDYIPDIIADNSEVVIVGGKAGEVWGPYIKAINNSKIDLYGFVFNANMNPKIWFPERMSGEAVIIENSALSMYGVIEDGMHKNPNPVFIVEKQGKEIRKLMHKDSPLRYPNLEEIGVTFFKSKK
jgi:hypothetical protein